MNCFVRMRPKPLIVTLSLDETSFEFFNEQRKKYFPPELNFLTAHLTLFHHLPTGEGRIVKDIETFAATLQPLTLAVEEVKFIGKGVVYKIASAELQMAHATLQKAWMPWLIPQDKQKLWPHITVQNKVAPHIAKLLHQELSKTFVPFTATGTGFGLWEYEGGPWKFVREFGFGM